MRDWILEMHEHSSKIQNAIEMDRNDNKWGRFYLLTGMPGFGSDKLCRDQQE